MQLRGCWRAGQTAGGSRNFASYATNPCFPLAVPEGGGPRCVRITLQQHCPDGECHPIGFHVFQARRSVCWGQGLGAASRGGGPSEDGCPRGWQVAARRPGRDRSGVLAMPARRLQDAFLGSTEATMPRGPQLRRPLVHWPGSGQLRHEVTSPQEAHWCHGDRPVARQQPPQSFVTPRAPRCSGCSWGGGPLRARKKWRGCSPWGGPRTLRQPGGWQRGLQDRKGRGPGGWARSCQGPRPASGKGWPPGTGADSPVFPPSVEKGLTRGALRKERAALQVWGRGVGAEKGPASLRCRRSACLGECALSARRTRAESPGVGGGGWAMRQWSRARAWVPGSRGADAAPRPAGS